MRRRAFVHLATGTLVSAGCIGAADSPSTRLADAARPDSDAASNVTRSGSRGASRTAARDDPTLAVKSVETPRFVVRLNDLGGDPNGRVTRFADLTEREREVVTTAIDGIHRTRDPPDWLVRFAGATPVVEREGTYYRLDHTFPTYRITAETASAGDVGGRIATHEEYRSAVTRDGYVLSSLLRAARRGGVELTYVWPDLRSFFDAYDAVRYRGEVVSFSVAVEDSGPPYELSADPVAVSAVAGGEVWNADAAPARARGLVRRAGRASGAYGFDRAPAGLLDRLATNEYVHLDGTFYAASVEKRGSVPISVSARVRDGRLRLVARNDGDAEVRLSSGPPRPFGVVRCRSTDSADAGHTLWTDAYAESDRVRTAGKEVLRVEDAALVSTLAPGEERAESYAVPAELPPGEYVVSDALGADWASSRDGESTVRYRVRFAVA